MQINQSVTIHYWDKVSQAVITKIDGKIVTAEIQSPSKPTYQFKQKRNGDWHQYPKGSLTLKE